jgi:hypothetical protein
MQLLAKLAFGALLSVGTMLPSGAAVSAPLFVPEPALERASEIQDVRWVRRCNYNRCRTVWVGPRYVRPRIVVRPRVVVRPAGNRHVRWCMNRYRSYDPSTNTFVAYDGDVRRCVSPYR